MHSSASGFWSAVWNPARLALLVLLLVSAGGDAPATEPPAPPQRHVFLWRISPASDSQGVLYVLGSTHAGRKPHERMDPAIEGAFAAADKLVVEVDTSQVSNSDIAKYAGEIGKIGDGTTLSAWVPADIYGEARSALSQQGMKPDALDDCKPWFAALTLTGNALYRLGYDPSFGVEEYFLQRAQDKQVVELEGARAQLQVLDSMSPEVQTVLLEETLRELHGLNHMIAALSDSWQDGDAERMGSLVFSGADERPTTEAFYERMYFARNRDMVRKLARSLANGGVWFAVIGAGHMVGERGIPALFAEAGYRVQQVAAQGAPLPSVSEDGTGPGFAILR